MHFALSGNSFPSVSKMHNKKEAWKKENNKRGKLVTACISGLCAHAISGVDDRSEPDWVTSRQEQLWLNRVKCWGATMCSFITTIFAGRPSSPPGNRRWQIILLSLWSIYDLFYASWSHAGLQSARSGRFSVPSLKEKKTTLLIALLSFRLLLATIKTRELFYIR